MQKVTDFLSQNLNLKLFNLDIPVPYIQAATVIVLIFLLILSMAKFRRHYIDWSAKGAIFGIFFGFLLALFLEGFLLVGGKTAITEVLGWKNAPKPIQVALDSGKTQLIHVLGVKDQIPSSNAKEVSRYESAVSVIQSLTPTDSQKLKNLLCKP